MYLSDLFLICFVVTGIQFPSHSVQVEGLRGENDSETTQDERPDIKGEDNAIEMTENFDGKLHDMEPDGQLLFLFLQKYKLGNEGCGLHNFDLISSCFCQSCSLS